MAYSTVARVVRPRATVIGKTPCCCEARNIRLYQRAKQRQGDKAPSGQFQGVKHAQSVDLCAQCNLQGGLVVATERTATF